MKTLKSNCTIIKQQYAINYDEKLKLTSYTRRDVIGQNYLIIFILSGRYSDRHSENNIII